MLILNQNNLNSLKLCENSKGDNFGTRNTLFWLTPKGTLFCDGLLAMFTTYPVIDTQIYGDYPSEKLGQHPITEIDRPLAFHADSLRALKLYESDSEWLDKTAIVSRQRFDNTGLVPSSEPIVEFTSYNTAVNSTVAVESESYGLEFQDPTALLNKEGLTEVTSFFTSAKRLVEIVGEFQKMNGGITVSILERVKESGDVQRYLHLETTNVDYKKSEDGKNTTQEAQKKTAILSVMKSQKTEPENAETDKMKAKAEGEDIKVEVYMDPNPFENAARIAQGLPPLERVTTGEMTLDEFQKRSEQFTQGDTTPPSEELV